jgi:hypothetical protein
MIRLFCGFDPREAIGWHAFTQSVIENCKEPLAIIPILGDQHDGSNSFTYSRFLVPELCDFSGFAIFADGADMLALGDFAELWAMRDSRKAVQVVKHDYKTKHPRKYVGTELECKNEDYPRKNWSSLILWNCAYWAHFRNREKLGGSDGKFLHRFEWLKDEEIGELPKVWNWLADEYGENQDAKILHWTSGIPGFYHYKNAPQANEWRGVVRNVTRGLA